MEVIDLKIVDPTQFDKDSQYFDPKSKPENPRWDCVKVKYISKSNQILSLPELKILFSQMSDNCELKWQPTKDQLDNMILPAYTDMAKQSVAYVNKFGCPPEYVADMLRDIADALTSIHPESESDSGCSCC